VFDLKGEKGEDEEEDWGAERGLLMMTEEVLTAVRSKFVIGVCE